MRFAFLTRSVFQIMYVLFAGREVKNARSFPANFRIEFAPFCLCFGKFLSCKFPAGKAMRELQRAHSNRYFGQTSLQYCIVTNKQSTLKVLSNEIKNYCKFLFDRVAIISYIFIQ